MKITREKHQRNDVTPPKQGTTLAPGDYDLPAIMGKTSKIGGIDSKPKYTMAPKTKVPFISNDYLKNFLGAESNLTALYHPQYSRLKFSSPKAPIGRATRFEKLSSMSDYKPILPVSYVEEKLEGLKNSSISKAPRKSGLSPKGSN